MCTCERVSWIAFERSDPQLGASSSEARTSSKNPPLRMQKIYGQCFYSKRDMMVGFKWSRHRLSIGGGVGEGKKSGTHRSLALFKARRLLRFGAY